ncbi:MAG: cytochrome P460 family protein [Acidobacteriota bacterium]
MKNYRIPWTLLSLAALWSLWSASSAPGLAAQSEGAEAVRYDEEGNLLLPQDWKRWVLVGTSLGLGYSEVETQPPTEAFHNVLMEPSSYDHYQRTGEFPDKTILALAIYSQARRESIARSGSFAKDLLALEMALKDPQRFEEGWAYFNFGRERPRSKAFPQSSCYSCHVEHGQQDNVFVQFYPNLGPAGGTNESAAARAQQPGPAASQAPAQVEQESPSPPQLALEGNDPVLLVKGELKTGREEFEAVQGPFRYRFATAESLAAFKAEPKRFVIQNEWCPVIPSAKSSPDLYHVHQGKIYIFASPNCIEDFKADPSLYLPAEQ